MYRKQHVTTASDHGCEGRNETVCAGHGHGKRGVDRDPRLCMTCFSVSQSLQNQHLSRYRLPATADNGAGCAPDTRVCRASYERHEKKSVSDIFRKGFCFKSQRIDPNFSLRTAGRSGIRSS
jgi:hypothetical protein